MIYEITVQEQGGAEAQERLRIHGTNWYEALSQGLPHFGMAIETAMAEFGVQVLDDGCSAVLTQAGSALEILVLALGKSKAPEAFLTSAAPDPAPQAQAAIPDTEEMLVVPSLKPDSETFSLNGSYVKGMTTDFLTEAFMKVGDLYGNFGDDVEGAMTHLFDMLKKAVSASGGSLLLTNIDDPSGALSFAYTTGIPKQEQFQAQIPLGQGAIGLCAKTGTTLMIDDLPTDPRFPEETLLSLGWPIGPMLCVPIHKQTQLLGVLVLFRTPPANPFTKGECNIFDYLSRAISDYITASGALGNKAARAPA